MSDATNGVQDVSILVNNEKKRKKKKGKLKTILIILVLIVVFFVLYKKFFSKSTTTTAIELPPITVTKEVSKNQIQISGYIEAAQQQKFESPGEGIVETVKIKEGDKVKKGQLLFALDSKSQEVQLAKQVFAIEQEKINGASKKITLMQKERELLEKQLKDRSVYAKFDGVVAYLNLDQGQYAKAQDNFGTLIDRSYLKATVEVSESYAYRLAIGQKANLYFSAVPGVVVEGIVQAFPAIARLNSQRGNTVLDTKIIVENPPKGVLPGYSFSGSIIAGEDEEVLICDKSAIRYEEGQPFVDRILDDGKTQAIKVEVAPYIQGFVKFYSGVEEGYKLKNQTVISNTRNGPGGD
ncbi:MAG: efflux RND transporter periplasmic adaptor subunit [Treponema sp.]